MAGIRRDTIKLFNFASDFFSRGRYYRENKLPQKFYTSIVPNGISLRNTKIDQRELTCHLQNAKINSSEIK